MRDTFRSLQVLCKLVQKLQRLGKNSAINDRLMGENQRKLKILSSQRFAFGLAFEASTGR